MTIVQLRINNALPNKDKAKAFPEGGGPTSRAGFIEGNDQNGSLLECMQENPGVSL